MLNKVQLIGNIAHNLEKQYINSNNDQIPKIDFNLAINNKDKVQYIPCVVFRNQAENMSTYLNKGSKNICRRRIIHPKIYHKRR